MSILSFLSSPVTLAAAAVIALGVVIYEIVNAQEEGMHHTRRSRPDRKTTSSRSSGIVSYEDTVNSVRQRERNQDTLNSVRQRERNQDTLNSVRQRNQNETTVKSCSPTNTKSQDKLKLSEESTRKFDEKGYYQNVFDKIGNDLKNLNKDNDDKKTFHKNIDDCPADDSTVHTEEIKVINRQASNVNQKSVQPHARNVLDSKENVSNRKTNPINHKDPCCSSSKTFVVQKRVVNKKQNNSENDNSLCTACEEVQADAMAYPCKHCYLCINCAIIVHRIYTKCSVCDSEIEYFQSIKK